MDIGVLGYHISLLNPMKFQFTPSYSLKDGACKTGKYVSFFRVGILLLIVLNLPFSEAE